MAAQVCQTPLPRFTSSLPHPARSSPPLHHCIPACTRPGQLSSRCLVSPPVHPLLFPRPTGRSRAHSHPWGPNHPLTAQLQLLIRNASAGSTRATYSSGVRRFIQFCHKHAVLQLPASKLMVAYFATDLSRSLAPSSIAVYVAAVASLHRSAGLRDPTRHNPLLQLAKRGARRVRGPPASPPHRLITAQVLADLLAALKHFHPLCQHDWHMLAAAFSLAFYGFIRISEFTLPSLNRFDAWVHASAASICWGKEYLTFHIRQSKTDQCSHGQRIRIPWVGGPLCPFAAMVRYTAGRVLMKPPNCTPLFSFASGQPLTRPICLSHLRRLLRKAHYPAESFNTHSFRIGAATSAAQSGLSSTTIKRLGRWQSSAYRRYIRPHATCHHMTRVAHPTASELPVPTLPPSFIHTTPTPHSLFFAYCRFSVGFFSWNTSGFFPYLRWDVVGSNQFNLLAPDTYSPHPHVCTQHCPISPPRHPRLLLAD